MKGVRDGKERGRQKNGTEPEGSIPFLLFEDFNYSGLAFSGAFASSFSRSIFDLISLKK